MYDRRVRDWVEVYAFLFDVSFDDELSIEVQVNNEFETSDLAEIEAVKYAESIGRLPSSLRQDVETVWIHKGTEPFGGGNHNILIHVGEADLYVLSADKCLPVAVTRQIQFLILMPEEHTVTLNLQADRLGFQLRCLDRELLNRGLKFIDDIQNTFPGKPALQKNDHATGRIDLVQHTRVFVYPVPQSLTSRIRTMADIVSSMRETPSR